MNQKIYLDNAATTIHKPATVPKAVSEAVCNLGNSGRGSHASSMDASRMIYKTREMLAELFQADKGEQVAFAANSTHALNIAIKGILSPGDHVITTEMEHNSVLRPLYEMENTGLELTILSCNELGCLEIEDLERKIRENTKAVVCTHASNVTGNINDIKKIGSICKKHDIIFILDASQTAGVIPIQMKDMGIDVVCFTGHKGLMGPQGTGGICIREGIEIRPLYSGGSGFHSFLKAHPSNMPTVLEAGTLNVHGIAGLHAALKFIQETGLERIHQKEYSLSEIFYQEIKDIQELNFYGDFSSKRVGIVSLNIGDYDSSIISDELVERFDIYTRPGAHCAPLMHQRFQTEKQGMVRFSFGYFNTEKEVRLAARAIRMLVEEN